MSCTLDELHDAYFEMMCKFTDYCETNNITYSLYCGTLLGTVRHNNFIPWDDDVDIIMDINSFEKLKKCLKDKPLEGYFFQWINTEKLYPLNFAKIRKDDTFVPEWAIKELEIHKGIWIDIFVYFNRPKSSFGIKIQENLLKLFTLLGKLIIIKLDKDLFGSEDNSHISNKLLWLPNSIIQILRKIIFFIAKKLGSDKSENVFVFDYDINSTNIQKKIFEPTTYHLFRNKEFRIPKNYDANLIEYYGKNYMTPIETHTHMNLQYVELQRKK